MVQCLNTYGFDTIEQQRGAAVYVDRILRGAKPDELRATNPTERPGWTGRVRCLRPFRIRFCVIDGRSAPERLESLPQRPPRYHGPLVVKSMLVAAAMMVLFFAGAPVPIVAIVGGALLLFTRSITATKIYLQIDWPLLLMFVGLFVVIAGVERTVLSPQAIAAIGRMHLASMPVLATLTAALSNLVSNVPAVLALKPFVMQLDDPQRAWRVVAMASTLAGNLTLVGSVANLIVAQRAHAEGVTLSFWAYLSAGAPLTVVTILVGLWWL